MAFNYNITLGTGLSATTNPDPNGIGLTFTANATTDELTTAYAHGLVTGDVVNVATTTTLPSGLSASTDYYARVVSTTVITLHTTAAGASANTGKVDITSTGSGTHRLVGIPILDNNAKSWSSNVSRLWQATIAGVPYGKALFPIDARGGEGELPIKVCFNPSGGAAITYTVTVWQYISLLKAWVKPYDNPSFNFTGPVTHKIANPGENPIYLQLSSISSGTISAYIDGTVCEAH